MSSITTKRKIVPVKNDLVRLLLISACTDMTPSINQPTFFYLIIIGLNIKRHNIVETIAYNKVNHLQTDISILVRKQKKNIIISIHNKIYNSVSGHSGFPDASGQ